MFSSVAGGIRIGAAKKWHQAKWCNKKSKIQGKKGVSGRNGEEESIEHKKLDPHRTYEGHPIRAGSRAEFRARYQMQRT